MGTNFYHVTEAAPPCECCGRGDPEQRDHIGKSSCGWTFSWCGLKHRSVADWRAALEAGGHIEDEYGDRHSVADFLAHALERGDKSKLHRHYDWMQANMPTRMAGEWLDETGESFSAHEFS